jgi:hypothetical protein
LRDEAGVREDTAVAVVTMGTPGETAAFCKQVRLPFICLSDPSRASYRAFGLKRGGVNEVMGPAPALAGLRAAAKGHFVGRPVNDVYQLGGLFLIDADGRIRYARYPRHAGDNPPPGEIRRVISLAGHS